MIKGSWRSESLGARWLALRRRDTLPTRRTVRAAPNAPTRAPRKPSLTRPLARVGDDVNEGGAVVAGAGGAHAGVDSRQHKSDAEIRPRQRRVRAFIETLLGFNRARTLVPVRTECQCRVSGLDGAAASGALLLTQHPAMGSVPAPGAVRAPRPAFRQVRCPKTTAPWGRRVSDRRGRVCSPSSTGSLQLGEPRPADGHVQGRQHRHDPCLAQVAHPV
jgi:hypothetical protein